ncbi:hypothetical protein COLO4_20255 [Corchorus olitorius]|uniref:Uncharacterized protein n=1 Tax=Corchorus olitorius TaxID=93759 RepID=A0A1R3J0T6_9ROSI|nr:hypothetical protein COLO4_20255 [Corchorus olitorius]
MDIDPFWITGGQLLSSSSTTNLHPFPTSPSSSQAATSTSTTHTSKTAKRQFQAAAHEVPSGPNPESNKHLPGMNLRIRFQWGFEARVVKRKEREKGEMQLN